MTAARKPLIIAEKPSAARAIAEALGGFSRREGYLESDRYRLSWAIGHLVEQKAPEEYDPRWKRWSLESLPILPERFGLKVVAKTKRQFQVLAKLARQAPELINACDAGREGELIFRYICEMAGVQAPVRRLWVSALTREAIRKAFADLRPQSEYDRLYQSALCRARGDWLVGMNATRAFTVKWGELLSVGRVQTPTLALLVRREREIAAFVPEDYWEVHADFRTADGKRTYRGKWFGPDGDRLKKREEAEAIAARVQAQPGTVESVTEKPVTEKPPQLFDLTALQREANRRFGLTAAATLKAAQSLYEAKLITYPRTDSRYLSRDLVRTLPGVLRALSGQPDFAQAAAGADLKRVHPGNFRVVNDAKVTDHHAIIPTAERPTKLGAVEAKIYGLIARRFLAQFYPEARYMETEVITRVGPHPDRFRSRGRRVLQEGWRTVEPPPAPARKRRSDGDDEQEQSGPLPPLTQGEAVIADQTEVKEKQTRPPRRYTEASLLAAMESAGRAIDDEELREAMKGRGLGTPATRAAIIERLKEVGYITREKKHLVPTPKGHRLVELSEAAGAQVLLSAELTGEWEKRIADIQGGSYDPDRFMAEIRELTVHLVELARKAPATSGPSEGKTPGEEPGRSGAEAAYTEGPASDASQQPTAGACPLCGRPVIRGGRDWRCETEGCPLRIPTWLCGKLIDAGVAGQLLTQGRTALIRGFRSPRTGRSFSAYLVLREGSVAFEFPPDRPRRRSGARRSKARGTTGEQTAKTKAGSRQAGGAARRRSGGA